jgi:hypothetical protein
MQSLETIKTKSQENLNRLVEMGKAQPTEVKTWGVTGGAAVIGAVTLAAIAQGVLAVLATLANPPVALAVGALAGGAIGWSLMQQPNATTTRAGETPQPEAAPLTSAPVAEMPVVETPVVETPVVETPVAETPVVGTLLLNEAATTA